MANITTFDFNGIIFSKQKVKSDNKFLYVYKEKKPLVFKLPKLRVPFGLQKDEMYNKNQYILDFSLDEQLIDGFNRLDDAIIKKVHDEFYSEKTEDQVREMYTSCVKIPSNESFSPTLRAKIPINNGVPKCSFYENERDVSGNFIKIDVIEKGNETYILQRVSKGTYNESIVECIGLWFFKDRFGLSFKVSQLKLHKNEVVAKVVEADEDECAFVYSDSDTTNSDVDFLD